MNCPKCGSRLMNVTSFTVRGNEPIHSLQCSDNDCFWKEIQDEMAAPQSSDPINPSHYNSGTIECITAMEAMLTPEEFRGFLRGNSFKYRWRYRQKNGVEDLKKAEWYEKKLLELESKEHDPSS